jgi:proprotein convertase subtilisin/kexin type 5
VSYVKKDGKCTHTCLTQDPTGFPKIDGGVTKCTTCHSSCKTCFADGKEGCMSCKAGQKMAGSMCVDKCPDGWYGPNSKGQCERCMANCKTCTAANNCSACTNGKYLAEGICHDVCPDPKKYGGKF